MTEKQENRVNEIRDQTNDVAYYFRADGERESVLDLLSIIDEQDKHIGQLKRDCQELEGDLDNGAY